MERLVRRDIDGGSVGFNEKLQGIFDVPSMDNKVQEHGLDNDGGLSPRQGIFADQTAEAGKVNLVDRDPAKMLLVPDNKKALAAIAVGALALFVIVRYIK